jgi:glycosyltransferase involved in cell wall biosynthesis
VQQADGIPVRRRWLVSQLRQHAGAVVAIDATVRASLPTDLDVRIVHNGFSPDFREAPEQVAALARCFHAGSLRVGMLGNLLALKGVYDFLGAAKLCVDANANVDFVVIGSNPRRVAGMKGALLRWFGFAHDVEGDVDRYLAEHGLRERVQRVGFTPQISAVYRQLDVLCFPSHLDSVGRPVLEAAWFGVPSVVAVDRPTPDTLIDGETGFRVPARDPGALASALMWLAGNRQEVKRMGDAARRLAKQNFDAQKNALEMLDVYRRALGIPIPADSARRHDDVAV